MEPFHRKLSCDPQYIKHTRVILTEVVGVGELQDLTLLYPYSWKQVKGDLGVF